MERVHSRPTLRHLPSARVFLVTLMRRVGGRKANEQTELARAWTCRAKRIVALRSGERAMSNRLERQHESLGGTAVGSRGNRACGFRSTHALSGSVLTPANTHTRELLR